MTLNAIKILINMVLLMLNIMTCPAGREVLVRWHGADVADVHAVPVNGECDAGAGAGEVADVMLMPVSAPGVGSDFCGSFGTGGGRSVQDRSNLSFSTRKVG